MPQIDRPESLVEGRDDVGFSFERGEVGSTEDEFGEEGVDSGRERVIRK